MWRQLVLLAVAMFSLVLLACGGRYDFRDFVGGITGSGNAQVLPLVVSVTPGANASGVNRDSSIAVTFNIGINLSTFTMNTDTDTTCSGAFKLSTSNAFSTCVPMATNLTQSGNTVTIRPATLLSANTVYYIRITTAVQSQGGVTLQNQFDSQFTTGTGITPYNNEFGTDCSTGTGTIASAKSKITGAEAPVTPAETISGLIVTGIDRFGSFYVQKGAEALYVDVSTSPTGCGGSGCQGNKASHYGMQVGDEICLTITRGHLNFDVHTVKDFSAIRKTGLGTVAPYDINTSGLPASAHISRRARVSGFITVKGPPSGNVNHTLTLSPTTSIIIRDWNSGRLGEVSVGDYITFDSVIGWFSGAPQITFDSALGSFSTGTPPSYSVSGTVSGWVTGENFTITLNGAHPTVISANGPYTFSGSPTVSGQYTVAISVPPPNYVCTVSNASGYSTVNVTNVNISCTPKPMYVFDSWPDSAAAGTYPLAMVFYQRNDNSADITSALTTDSPLTEVYTKAYNLTSDARITGEGVNGVSFVNAGTAGPSNRYLGAAVITLDTTGKTNLAMNWVGRTIAAAPREYEITVQARPNPSATWTTLGSSYASNSTGHSQSFSGVNLNSYTNNIRTQIRFLYRYVGPTTGARPRMAIDDIVIYSTSNAKAWLTNFEPGVSATNVSISPSISVTFNTPMNPSSVNTANFYVVAGTNCANTPLTGTISASNGNRTFSFNLTSLSYSTTYSTCVKAAILDASGSDIAADRVISWTTEAAPTPFNVNSASSTSNTTVNVVFSHAPTPGGGANGAANASNYKIVLGSGTCSDAAAISVSAASLSGMTVTLTTASQSAISYRVCVSNVTRNSDSATLTTNSATFTGTG